MSEDTHLPVEEEIVPAEENLETLPAPEPAPATAADYLKPILLILLVLVLDQWLKIYIKTTMPLHSTKPLLGEGVDWAELNFMENNGIAFGLEIPGIWGKILLTSFRLLAAGLIFTYLMRLVRKHARPGLIISGALVFAGATGNIIDSVFYGVFFRRLNDYPGGWFQGRVVDMLHFPVVSGHWPSWVPGWGGQHFEFFEPIFNLADASITLGILLIIFFYRNDLKKA